MYRALDPPVVSSVPAIDSDPRLPSGKTAADRAILVTISIPVYDEAENIDRLLDRIDKVTKSLAEYDFEFLFTDNASEDATFDRLLERSHTDRRIRALRFTRNVGFQQSILANYLHARGDVSIQIDADLEDPPELIPEMLKLWKSGYKVVYGVRRRRQEPYFKTALRKAFYRLLNRLSEVDLPQDAGDFRLIDREVIERLRETRDQNPYLRGTISSFGYAQTGILYDRSSRTAGVSKFNFPKLIRLAVDGICSQSTKPLEIITFSGFLLSGLSIIGAAAYSIWYMITPDVRPGFTTLVFLVLIMSGINMAFLGVMGEYIGRIFRNTRSLPSPIIAARIEPSRVAPAEATTTESHSP